MLISHDTNHLLEYSGTQQHEGQAYWVALIFANSVQRGQDVNVPVHKLMQASLVKDSAAY